MASYGIMAFPLAFAGLAFYINAPDLYASSFGVPLAEIGLGLLLLRSFDAVIDPLIGILSDRYSAKRKTIVIGAALLLLVGFWLVFHPQKDIAQSWFLMSASICTLGFSILSINLLSFGGLWVLDENQRTAASGWREGFGLIGLLTATVAPSLLGANENPLLAFHRYTLVFVPLLCVCLALFYRWLGKAHLKEQSSEAETVREVVGRFRILVSSRWNLRFFSIFFLSSLASSIPAVLVVFFVRDYLDLESYLGIFLLIYFASGAVSMPFWYWLSKNIGKAPAWILSMVVASACFVWAYYLGIGDAWAFGAICAGSGFALGADLTLPPSMIADRIAQTQGQRNAASYYSLQAFASKAALALASGLALPGLAAFGYQPGTPVDDTGKMALPLFYAALPSAIKILVAIGALVSFSKINEIGTLKIQKDEA